MTDAVRLNRRELLRLGAGAAGLALLPGALGACGSKKKALSCVDTQGLSEADIQGRKALKYVDKSAKADQNCANCGLYQASQKPDSCGGCTILKGPINPAGYCAGWSKKVG